VPRRRTHRLLSVLLTVVTALTAAVAVASPAAAADLDPSAEQVLLSRLNHERAVNGRQQVRATTDLIEIARRHSHWMADTGQLAHNSQLGAQVRGWLVLSENVGYGGTPDLVHTALMNSSGHRANILDSRVSQVGVGAARDSRGRVWVTQVFRRPDAATTHVAGAVLPASLGGAPDLTAVNAGVWYAGERAPGGGIGVRTVTESGLAGPVTDLSGCTKQLPAVAAQDGFLNVVVRGCDDAVYLRTGRDGGAWSGWTALGGHITSPAAVTSWGSGRLDVVARGGDGQVWQRAMMSPGVWTNWFPLGGQVQPGTTPAITSSGPGNLTVAVQGLDQQVWVKTYSWAAGWSGWIPMHGWSRGGVAATSAAPGQVTLAVKGLDGVGYATTVANGRNNGWRSLGGQLVTVPSAAASHGRVDVMTLGLDHGYHLQTSWNGGAGWTGWRRIS
jgi:hypothetical protein